MNSDLHSIIGWALLLFIGLMPIWDYYEAKRLRQHCSTADRLRYYWIILIAHFLLGAGAIYCLRGNVLDAGGVLSVATSQLANPVLRYCLLGISMMFGLLALSPLISGLLKPEARKHYTRAVSKTLFAFMFPRVRSERLTFAALSVSAGIWEEIIFRSFLVYFFASAPFHLNPFLSLAIASLFFGVNHGYQGIIGVVKTGIGGFLFGILYFTTGSLILAMALHAVTDLSAIYMYRPDLLPESNDSVPAAA